MKKKIISIVVAVALVITSVSAYMVFNKDGSYVFAAEFREGYVIEPVDIDETGVAVTSEFLFKWEEDVEAVTLDELEAGLSVSPDTEIVIREGEEGFIIAPVNPLLKNTIYVFDFKGITWVYKTEAEFAVIGTFPRDKATNVPTNSGIEFVFNYEGAEVEDYVTIEPELKGRFEVHNKVVVFVPKELEEKTVYTVTLKAGLPLGDSDKKLSDDVVFSFETEFESDYEDQGGYLSFNSLLNEYGTEGVQEISWDYYVYDKDVDLETSINIYAYKDVNSFMAELDNYSAMPFWSNYGLMDNLMESKNLDKVMSFEYELEENPNYPNFLTLPDSLDAGFYLVDVEWNGYHTQTLAQVTDLSFYYEQNTNGDLFWVNDLGTQQPVEGASIELYGDVSGESSLVTDEKGLATKIGQRTSETADTKIYHIQKDNQHSVVYSLQMNNWYSYSSTGDSYWKYFKTDRSLYQPDDTVEFFGFAKGRYEEIDLDKVTVQVSQGGYYYWDFLPYSIDELALVKADVSVDNGFYSGKLELPNLAEGSYEISVKYEGDRIASSYLTVEKYVKPSYKIEIEGDKKAIFTDEAINYTVKTLFYEGTPVSKLDFNYNIGGITYEDGYLTTDLKGEQVISYVPDYVAGHQGPQYYYISAYADLPESGSIYTNSDFRVFFNDIHIEPIGSREGTRHTLTVQANDVVLDRINSGETESEDNELYSRYYNPYSADFLGDAAAEVTVDGILYRKEWIRYENGEYYDYINKEVRKQYSYDLETTKVESFSITTDENGYVEYSFDKPVEEDVYYTAELVAKDGKNRRMEYNIYFGQQWEYEPRYGDYYHLELDKENYDLDDEVTASFMNNQEIYKDGKYLFVVNQKGVLDVEVTDGPVFTTTFDEEYIPMARLTGVYFTGKGYLSAGNAQAQFDYSTKDIQLTIESDQTSYKPGDVVKIHLNATTLDANGNEVPVSDAVVNLSLVDEALLALSDMTINPLEDLYSSVNGYPLVTYASHGDGIQGGGYFRGYGMVTDETMEMGMDMGMDMAAVPMDGAEEMLKSDTSSNADVQVRSEFKDTALYAVVHVDANGEADLEFTLPHNVTSWRVTGAAISNELQAGSQEESLIVTLPFFLNTSISQMYLVGDNPYIGVTAYGTDLKEGESLNYSVIVEDAVTGGDIHSFVTAGQAFERVNLELGQFEDAGIYKVIVKGIREDGSGDAIELKVEVKETYHTKALSDYYSLETGLKIATNNEGNTTLTFVDEGKGFYLPTLYRLSYNGGKRVDQKYLGYAIAQILNQQFDMDLQRDEVYISDYMPGDGGVAILPYADTEVEITVNMLPLIKEEINTQMVLMYLQNSWYNDTLSEKGAVLYGLAQLGEPILYDLSQYAKIEDLDDLDKMYVALAYAEFGDLYKAKEIYNELIGTDVEEYDERAYINLGNDDDNYRLTALGMLLTEKLDLDIHAKYYDYLLNTYNKEYSVNPQLATYVLSMMEKVSQVEGSVTYEYNGTTVDLDLSGWGNSITIPSSTLNQLNITKVTGDLAVIASYEGALNEAIVNDDSLSVTRKYYNYQTNEETTTFNQGDIVKVVLNWNVENDAIDNYYQLSDYLPSGLEAINNPWNYGLNRNGGYSWFREVSDQKVSFFIYKDKEMNYDPLTYYARVTSPGTFNAEAPIIQGTNIQDSMYIGERDTIIITE